MTDATRPLLLVDFSNAAWRAAHAFRATGLADGGEPTTVVYGVLGEVGRAMSRFGTDRVALCCDHNQGPQKRLRLFPAYKARRHRDLSQEDIDFRATVGAGMKLTKRLLRAAGFWGIFTAPGYEADDLIAAFHGEAPPAREVVIVSTDKDLYQLIDGRTTVYRPGSKESLVTLQAFHRLYGGLRPGQWAVVKALAGCKSDNVPGLRGCGEQTAVKYLLDGVKAGKRRDAIAAHLLTPDYARDLDLVYLPFDGKLAPKCVQVTELGIKLTEPVWDAVCASAGIENLPYPQV